jgi:GT2 family glycosyltransferase
VRLREAIDRAVEARRPILLDLSGVRRIDEQAMGELFRLDRLARWVGISVRLAAAPRGAALRSVLPIGWTLAAPAPAEPAAADRPHISVIIPHLNEPEDLARCLAALTRQARDGVPFEIIVVDNGSRVPPVEICGAYPGVRLEIEREPGPGPARSRGAAVACGEIVAFIDCDCVPVDGWIAAMARTFATNPLVDFIGGDIRILAANPGRRSAIEAYEDVYSYRARLFVERDGYAATGNMAVRADVFRAVGPFGELGSAEDMDWGRRAMSLGFRVAYAPDVRVLTPACRTFGELARRVDRHVANTFQETVDTPGGEARWRRRSILMMISPLLEVGRVASTTRLTGIRERVAVFTCLCRVRLYRARQMRALLARGGGRELLASWNRE